MLLSFLFPARTVLLMGDEALRVYDTAAGSVKIVDAIPWQAEDFEDALADLIAHRCGGKSVLIINDMVEQHYRKERVPSAMLFDRAAIVERKLKSVFQNNPIRAALALKRHQARGMRRLGGALPGRMYLFTGVPMTEALRKTVAGIEKSLARLDGFVLLPIESAGMVDRLARKVNGDAGSPESRTRWSVFIGQHQGGGLRQIVVRDGELALTRMTPIIDTDLNPDDWGREIVQEFKSTMSYLARFGYEAQDGLDIFVVCGAAPTSYLEKHFRTEGTLHLLSSLDVSEHLGLEIGGQEDVRYADPLHAAWIGRKRAFSLPLMPGFIRRISLPREAVFSLVLLMGGVISWLTFNIFFNMQHASGIRNDLVYAQQQQAMARTNLEQAKRREDETGYNFLKVENTLNLYEQIESGAVDVPNLVRRLGIALRPGITYSAMEMSQSRVFELEQPGQDESEKPPVYYDVRLEAALDKTLTADEAFRLVNRLQDNLRKLFPKAEVVVTRHIADVNYSARVSGQAERQQSGQAGVMRSASLAIRGIIE